MKLSELIKQERFSSPAQHVLLNIITTSSWITGNMTAVMAPYGITLAQYNVLRILRGSHPKSLTCSEIGDRLLDRTPDVTRLLNRLERAGLITRERAGHDRRVVEVDITDKGLDLLRQMDPVIDDLLMELTKYLSVDEQEHLSTLLDRMRMDQR